MNYNLNKSMILLLVGAIFIIPASCDKLSEGEKAEEDLIGEWTASSVSVELSVGGVDFRQLLINTIGLSETAADSVIDEAFDEAVEAVTGGTISFNEDNTYSSYFEEEDDSGTWEININGSTLTLDAGTDDEDAIGIVSISSSSLVVDLPAETEEVDLDDDEVNETTLTIKMELTLTKSS